MYYAEKIIDGKLMCRHTPHGDWYPKNGDYATAVNAMLRLTDEQRNDVMRFFCKGCGTIETPCHCMKDE